MMSLRKLRRSPAALWRDNAGTGAMELALALPMLIMLIVGMVDVSRLVAARIDAEQAAQRATDLALAIRPNGSDGAYLKTEAAEAEGIKLGDVTVDIFLECDGVRQGNFNATCTPGEDRARFANVEIARDVEFVFDWSSMNALLGRNIMGSSITVRGDSLVRFQ